MSWESFATAYVFVGSVHLFLRIWRLWLVVKGRKFVPNFIFRRRSDGRRLIEIPGLVWLIDEHAIIITPPDRHELSGGALAGAGFVLSMLFILSAMSWPYVALKQISSAFRTPAHACRHCGRGDYVHPIFCAECGRQLRGCGQPEVHGPHPMIACHERWEVRCQDGVTRYEAADGAARPKSKLAPAVLRIPRPGLQAERRWDLEPEGLAARLIVTCRFEQGDADESGPCDIAGAVDAQPWVTIERIIAGAVDAQPWVTIERIDGCVELWFAFDEAAEADAAAERVAAAAPLHVTDVQVIAERQPLEGAPHGRS